MHRSADATLQRITQWTSVINPLISRRSIIIEGGKRYNETPFCIQSPIRWFLFFLFLLNLLYANTYPAFFQAIIGPRRIIQAEKFLHLNTADNITCYLVSTCSYCLAHILNTIWWQNNSRHPELKASENKKIFWHQPTLE